MTDPLDHLRQPVEPLAPPRGTFDTVLARARRRRTVRTSVLAALASLIVVGTGGLVVASGHPLTSGRLEGPPAGGQSAAPPPSPSRAVSTPTPRSSRSTAPSAPAAALPHGPVPRGFLPYSVTSVGGGVSYLLGDAPCRVAPCTSVLRTTDGGKSWVGVPAPKAPLPAWQVFGNPTNTVRDLRFASVRDGWAYGGGLYSTHDAGGTWRRVDAGGAVLDLATDGTTTYAVVATCNAQGSSCQNARLRSSPASADRWQDLPGIAGGTNGQLSLSGRSGVLLLGGTAPARLWTLAGTRWRPASLPTCPNGLSAVSTSASSARLFALCGEGAAGSLYLTTYSSDDAGGSWQGQSGSPLRLSSGQLSVAAPSATVIVAGSLSPDRPGRLAVGVDTGRIWTDTNVPSLLGGWRYVGARTASSVVALPGKPDGSIWSSGDGGATWTAYRFH